jgi:O-antigen/teichoic acid export membrane protein
MSRRKDQKIRESRSIAFIAESGSLIQTITTETVTPPGVNAAGEVDRSLASGIAWSAAAKWSSQLISWASFLVVARILAPSDFGLVGMAAIFTGLLQVATDAFVTAVTTIHDLTAEQLAQLNTVSALSGFLIFLLSCGIAVPLGHFFRSPRLPLVVVVASTMFLVSGFRTVPYSLLYRDMRFRLLSVFDAVQAVTQALTMLAMAWFGFGYWTLIIGNIVGALTLAALQISRRPYRFASPRLNSIKDALTFSRRVMAANISWYGYSNADFLIAGRMLGQTALGVYTLAWSLAMIPLEKVTVIISNVSFPFFSAAQNDHAALRRHLRILTEGLSLVIFPATIGLALVASDLVPLLLGKKWEAIIAPLAILAFLAAFRSLATLLPPILNVTGEARFVMWVMQGALIILPLAFYFGSRWGPVGIAYGWIIAYPAVAICLYQRTFRKIELPLRDYIGAVSPALTGTFVMVITVETLKHFLLSDFQLPVRLAAEVFGGASAFIFSLVIFHHGRLRVFWNFGLDCVIRSGWNRWASTSRLCKPEPSLPGN